MTGPARWARLCRRAGGQTGSGTVWVLVAAMALVAGTAVIVAVGAALVARHRSAAAADFAALAAARAAALGSPKACSRAAAIATANGATVSACSIADGVADVSVRRSLPGPFDQLGVRVRARAGPVVAPAGPGRPESRHRPPVAHGGAGTGSTVRAREPSP